MLALWELDQIHHLILYTHCTAVRQNSYGHYQAGKRMEPDTYTEVSVFYNQPQAVSWALRNKSIQRYSSVEVRTSKLKILLCETHFSRKLLT